MNRSFSLKQIMCLSAVLAANFSAYAAKVEMTAKAGSPKAEWKFELKNKSKDTNLYIQLAEGRKGILSADQSEVAKAKGSKESEAGYLRIANVEPGKSYKIFIWKKRDDQAYRALINPSEVFEIKANKNRKTILLTYEDGKLRPQKGNRLKGMVSGYSSASGLSIFGNVKSEDIARAEGMQGVRVQV